MSNTNSSLALKRRVFLEVIYNYFEQTTKNLESIATINKNTETIRQLQHDNDNLKASLENPINAEFIAKYKEAK